MQNRDMMFAKEGHPWVFGSVILFMATLPLGRWWISVPLGLLVAFSCWFFRNPERAIPADDNVYVSPADGKVLRVSEVSEDRYLYRTMQKVEIFMSPLDVHVNRVPRTGQVIDTAYTKGRFVNASLDKASRDNEQNAIVVRDREGRDYMFVQIAGFIARRIVSYVRAGKEIEQGQRMGMIKFGSRLDVYLPLEARPAVKGGEKVKAGESVIGRIE